MDNLYSKLKRLCEEKGISLAKMCVECGISKSTPTELKSGRTKMLSSSAILKIANYFGVSVEYLAGETNKKEPSVTIDGELEEDVIIFHRDGKTQKKKLTAEQRAIFMAMIDALPDTSKDDI